MASSSGLLPPSVASSSGPQPSGEPARHGPRNGIGHRISLDTAVNATRKADKNRRYNTVQVPGLRLLGFLILLSIVAAHAWSTAALPWPRVGWLALAFLGYSLATWIVLHRLHGRTRVDLGTVFLATDPFVWMGATYLTGGAESWLFILPLVRVADQLNTSRMRAFGFTIDGVAAYTSLLVYIALVDGQPVLWSQQVARMFLLTGCGAYLALTAGTAERLRHQLGEAIRTARDSIRRLQEQSVLLEDAREKAEAGSRAKSQFLANMSHEFRTPLNAIIGYTELLQEEVPDAQGSTHEDLRRINRSAQHLRGLVNDVIELSRVDAGRVAVELEQVEVAALLSDVASVVTPLIRANGNTLEMTGVDDAGDMVTDPLKVRQILVNIVGNAGKFTHHGSIALSCSRGWVDGVEMLTFRVADTGIGMDDEQLARILKFEPFVQADASITRRYGGTGLGLTISQRLTRLMGGSLTIESRPGEGATVTCRLPAIVGRGARP